MNYKLYLENIKLNKNTLFITFEGEIEPGNSDYVPRLKFYFETEGENRILPIVLEDITYTDKCTFTGTFGYRLDIIFWEEKSKKQESTCKITLDYGDEHISNCDFILGEEFGEDVFESDDFKVVIKDNTITIKPKKITKRNQKIVDFFGMIFYYCWSIVEYFPRKKGKVPLSNENKKRNIIEKFLYLSSKVSKRTMIRHYYRKYAQANVKKNQIAFVSQRSEELEGNLKCVYDEIAAREDLKVSVRTYLDKTFLFEMSLNQIKNFAKICAESEMIIVDEYVEQVYIFNVRPESKVVQLWHACGAFKTFGFSRLGKEFGSRQWSRVHRNYDMAIVSSENIRKCYSEGFGISLEKVVATGVPRTDVFFDENFKYAIKEKIYDIYPQIKDKKVILFAPTFRGDNKQTAHYPMDKFDISMVMDNLPEDYVILIKHHPFVLENHYIPEKYANRVIDVGSYPDINELLFVTDTLITDYSSVIFEAGLLNIKMVFYAFDLEEYIRERDFYFDFKTFVPGEIAKTKEELIEAIKDQNMDMDKLEVFKEKYLDACQGDSTKKVIDKIRSLIL